MELQIINRIFYNPKLCRHWVITAGIFAPALRELTVPEQMTGTD